MWSEHVKLLCCPKTKRSLEVQDAQLNPAGEIVSGKLVERQSQNEYPIIGGIPRFVPATNYADSFGFQWNLHRSTQHDKHSGLKASEERFWNETGWERELNGQLILEAGAGSGRFTKFPLESGATVVSIDYSRAVEENYKHHSHYRSLLLVQADIFSPPFPTKQFDKIFCFGVLQHTPNPEGAFKSLVPLLKPGGKFAADIYLKSLVNYYLNPYYYARRFTKNQAPEKLYSIVTKYVDTLWPLVRTCRKIPKLGTQINRRILMVADHANQFPNASDETLKQWAYLDTFDWLSPQYDLPQTPETFYRWYKECGFTNIDVHRGYNGVEGRATLGST